MRTAKKEAPFYIVHEITQEEIFNFRPLAHDQHWKRIKIMNLRQITVSPNDVNVLVNYAYTGEPDSVLIDNQKTVGKKYPLTKLYNKKIPMDSEKRKDLRHMCATGIIPPQFQEFYMQITQ